MIEHIVVVMLENRSFDHMLGRSGLTGRDARTGAPTALDGLTGTETNALDSGQRVAVDGPAAWALAYDPPHEFGDVLEQLCGPGPVTPPTAGGYPAITNGGFAASLARRLPAPDSGDLATMRAFDPAQLPVLHALASEYAVCDRWFSSVPGPTWPNRFFAHAASSSYLDGSPSAVRSSTAIADGYRFANGTIYDRLDAAGLGWSIVEGSALPQSLAIHGMIERALEGRYITVDELRERLDRSDFGDRYVFVEPDYGHILVDGRNFTCGCSQHPQDDVTRGEAFLKGVYEMVRGSRYWESTLLLITYDEHGGFYDHVAPPAAVAPGDAVTDPGNNQHGFDFTRLGVRVPAVVVSAHTPGGVIDHTQYDHTSILATVERLFGLAPLTDRDRQARDLSHLVALPGPRDDAPETLPAPASSGLADCEDSAVHRVLAALDEAPVALLGEVEPALRGFVHVAVARQLHLAAAGLGSLAAAVGRERKHLDDRLASITSRFDAARLLAETHEQYRAWRS